MKIGDSMMNRRPFIVAMMAAIAMRRGAFGSGPKSPGYFAPAEESRHARTWMCWPSTPSIYGRSTSYFESVQETIGRLAAAIAEHEPAPALSQLLTGTRLPGGLSY